MFERLKRQLVESGLVAPDPKIRLTLVAGRFKSDEDEERIRGHFSRSGWILWGQEWLREGLQELAEGAYEGRVVPVMAKLWCQLEPQNQSTSDPDPGQHLTQ